MNQSGVRPAHQNAVRNSAARGPRSRNITPRAWQIGGWGAPPLGDGNAVGSYPVKSDFETVGTGTAHRDALVASGVDLEWRHRLQGNLSNVWVVPSHLRYKWRFGAAPNFDMDNTGYGERLPEIGRVFENSLRPDNRRQYVLYIYTKFRIWIRKGINRVKAKLATLPLLLGNRGGRVPSNRSLVPRQPQNMTTTEPAHYPYLLTEVEAAERAADLWPNW